MGWPVRLQLWLLSLWEWPPLEVAHHLAYLKSKRLYWVHVYTATDRSHISCCKESSLACRDRAQCIIFYSFSAFRIGNIPNKAHPPPFLTAIDNNGVIVAAWDHVFAISTEVDAVYTVSVLSKHFRDPKGTKNFVGKFHTHDNFYRVVRVKCSSDRKIDACTGAEISITWPRGSLKV